MAPRRVILRLAAIVAALSVTPGWAQDADLTIEGRLEVYDADLKEETCQGKTLLLVPDDGLSVAPVVCRFDDDCRWRAEATLLRPQGRFCFCSGTSGYKVYQPRGVVTVRGDRRWFGSLNVVLADESIALPVTPSRPLEPRCEDVCDGTAGASLSALSFRRAVEACFGGWQGGVQ